jgi:uncharacterized protein
VKPRLAKFTNYAKLKKLLMAQQYCAYLVGMKSILIILAAAVWLALPLAPCFADSPSFAETRANAEQGDAKAQYKLGLMYQEGEGVPKNYAEAVKWYRKAAAQGDADARSKLALWYALGHGNDADTLEWLRKSAEQGDADAQYNLGNKYLGGEGVPKNYAEAVEWYTKAAEQSYAKVQDQLGYVYAGEPRDHVQAYMWLSLAAAKGDEYAKNLLNSIEPHMTPDEIAEAQKRAAAWKPKAN